MENDRRRSGISGTVPTTPFILYPQLVGAGGPPAFLPERLADLGMQSHEVPAGFELINLWHFLHGNPILNTRHFYLDVCHVHRAGRFAAIQQKYNLALNLIPQDLAVLPPADVQVNVWLAGPVSTLHAATAGLAHYPQMIQLLMLSPTLSAADSVQEFTAWIDACSRVKHQFMTLRYQLQDPNDSNNPVYCEHLLASLAKPPRSLKRLSLIEANFSVLHLASLEHVIDGLFPQLIELEVIANPTALGALAPRIGAKCTQLEVLDLHPPQYDANSVQQWQGGLWSHAYASLGTLPRLLNLNLGPPGSALPMSVYSAMSLFYTTDVIESVRFPNSTVKSIGYHVAESCLLRNADKRKAAEKKPSTRISPLSLRLASEITAAMVLQTYANPDLMVKIGGYVHDIAQDDPVTAAAVKYLPSPAMQTLYDKQQKDPAWLTLVRQHKLDDVVVDAMTLWLGQNFNNELYLAIRSIGQLIDKQSIDVHRQIFAALANTVRIYVRLPQETVAAPKPLDIDEKSVLAPVRNWLEFVRMPDNWAPNRPDHVPRMLNDIRNNFEELLHGVRVYLVSQGLKEEDVEELILGLADVVRERAIVEHMAALYHFILNVHEPLIAPVAAHAGGAAPH